MRLPFCKYHGTGNDFIIIDQRKHHYPLTHENIESLCNRHFGIGADGLMEFYAHPELAFEMKYYNSDGAEATMCGNGGRCMVLYARKLGLENDHLLFQAIDGIHEARVLTDSNISLKMSDVSEIKEWKGGFLLDTGSPHLVFETDNLQAMDLNKEGKAIRTAFSEEGANVNFIEVKGAGEVWVRTYERGVENETLSCGTGAVASALVFDMLKGNSFNECKVHATGGDLLVGYSGSAETGFTDIWLTGPAAFVFEGVIGI
jgi:diaminopimelate epimerase